MRWQAPRAIVVPVDRQQIRVGGNLVDSFVELLSDERRCLAVLAMAERELLDSQQASVVEAGARAALETLGAVRVARMTRDAAERLRPGPLLHEEKNVDLLADVFASDDVVRLRKNGVSLSPVTDRPSCVARYRSRLGKDCNVFVFDVFAK